MKTIIWILVIIGALSAAGQSIAQEIKPGIKRWAIITGIDVGRTVCTNAVALHPECSDKYQAAGERLKKLSDDPDASAAKIIATIKELPYRAAEPIAIDCDDNSVTLRNGTSSWQENRLPVLKWMAAGIAAGISDALDRTKSKE